MQLYRQSSLKNNGAKKIKSKYFGSYRIIRRISEVTYELKLPQDNEIYNIYHVSCLKKGLEQKIVPTIDLPLLDDEMKSILLLEKFWYTKERRFINTCVHFRIIDQVKN